jgi:UDP:flavonoid glycosyltransferase YjiC (YdhE family)
MKYMRIFQTLLAFSGNAPPQLALTRELVERGHEVRVLAHGAARARIESTGAEFVAIRGWFPDLDITHPETDPVRDWEARTSLGAAKRMRDAPIAPLRDATREDVEMLDEWSADVVVFDWMLTAAPLAAERAGIPAVALVHCPYPFPVSGAPPLFSGAKPMGGPLGTARDGLLNAMNRRFSAAGLPVLNEIRAEYGLNPLKDWNDQVLGVRAIYVMSAPELDYSSKARLPGNVHYVGPAFEPFEKEWESPWRSDNTDPLVLISFSTSYMNQRALAQRVLDAVAGLHVRALLTAGPALDPRQLRLPDNARSVAFVSHRTVLPHAALVVTHAGWQTVNAALADGVPLVCIPDGRDQPDNAARVVVAHAGVRASKKSSPEKLRRVISRALEDQSIKRGARAMAGALGRSDGRTVMADELERIQVHNAVP